VIRDAMWLLVAIGMMVGIPVGFAIGWKIPRPAPPSVTMTCRQAPLRMTSDTPGVVVEPILQCWRKLP
jgi:hypothetical protein